MQISLRALVSHLRPRKQHAAALVAILGLSVHHAQAAPSILVDAASGDVLDQVDATRSWFPASTTKLMTVYVALDAVAAGRISLNTPLLVSPRALSMAPSKMGFAPGTQVTLDNALKMLMVKSANDIAVTIAEGVSGSVEGFADEMNAAAAKLGMHESRFYNPNGLPDARHVSSARDLAVLARALLLRFPERADLYDIGAMRLGNRIFPTHNGLLGRYPGADGMKTGFTCAAGFNVVATATRGGRRLIAVVLGAPSATARTMKAASLFNRGFAGQVSNGGSVTSLASAGVAPAPDMRNGVCQNRAKAQKAYLADIQDTAIPLSADLTQTNQPERSFLSFGAASAPQVAMLPSAVVSMPRPVFTPIDVFVGPVSGWTGTVAHAVDYDGSQASVATAYAPDKAATDTPLKASDDALPMKRGKALARTRIGKAPVAVRGKPQKVAHLPTPKIIADEPSDETPATKTKAGVKSDAKAKPAKGRAAEKAAVPKPPVKVAKVVAKPPHKPAAKAKKPDAE